MRKQLLPYGRHCIDAPDIEAVAGVLKADWITGGPKVGEFEEKFAGYCGARHGVAVNSGTAALDIAVGALGIKPGSEVITTPFTFAATSNCLLYNGLRPVYADIDPRTYNIDPEQVKKRITPKTKAIIYVDYAGQPCDIAELREIAGKHGLYLIEDAAHAAGAEYGGKKIGTFADMTTFSFHPVKHITTGEGGMVTTGNADYDRKLRMLRNHGIDKSAAERGASWAYDMKMLGKNYRITDFQCALGISQLSRLDANIRRREAIVKQYDDEFVGIPEVTIPHVKQGRRSAWHLYTILLDRKISRDRFFESMRKRNIGVNVHYIPTYRFTYYKENFKFNPNDYPVTEDVFSRIITLPIFAAMSDQDARDVCEAVRASVSEAS
jgi:UDP-4-amino-4,6-dideoxy-N-acetyl-beta-L-altrosamine transaminase